MRTRRRSCIAARGRAALVLLGASLLIAGTTAATVAQTPPPDGAWLTFRTEHFRITYQPGLESAARRAAVAAERTHALLREELAPSPQGPIELVVTDHVDFTNGYAMPFTSNRIVVFARPPVDIPQLAYARDWIELVVAHEIVHIFHMDPTGPVGRGLRRVFGRVPMVWPIFPVVGTPTWSLEGLATHYESRLTGAGRVRGSFHGMIVRTAALETRIPDLRELSTPNPLWPGGQRSYVYGSLFMQWISDTYGAAAHERIIRSTTRSWRPTFLFFDHVARDATGRGYRVLYDEWRAVATAEAQALRERLVAQGLTESEPVVDRAPFAVAPRLSPDGRRLSYGAYNLRSDPATRVLDLSTGETTALTRRNQLGSSLGAAPWLPDGSAVIVEQLEYRGPYRITGDLWRVGPRGSSRITTGARVSQPDPSPDGRSLVAIRNDRGSLDLVLVDPASGAVRTLVAAESGDAFADPRWSPDGRAIAVAIYRDGRVDLGIVDARTGALTRLTYDDALDGAPAWSPDGRWIVWWSDRTGIANLYALDPEAPGEVRQVTSVLGGAFDPEISPDGRWLYFSAYHADGWRIERLPFEPGSWRRASPSRLDYRPGLIPPPRGNGGAGQAAPAADRGANGVVDTEPRPYSPFPSLRPYFWLPTYETTAFDHVDADRLRFIGAYAFGRDVLQRHEWAAMLAVDPASGRVAGGGGWTYRGFGQPSFTLTADRDWSRAGILELETDRETVYLREDRLALQAVVLRPRWRSIAALGVGAELASAAYELHDVDRSVLGNQDPPTRLGASVRPSFSNTRTHPLSISRENGLAAAFMAGRWWMTDGFGHSYDQLQGRLSGYRGLDLGGFANHVLAARVAGRGRFGNGAYPTEVGGASGTAAELGLTGLGGASLLLPVRGFDRGAISGTRAWTASAEYRAPVYLFGYRTPVLGLSLTSISGALFADAGSAWCTPAQAGNIPGCAADATRADEVRLISAGAELNIDMGILHGAPIRVRGGLALPLRGPVRHPDEQQLSPRNWQLYLRLGPSF